MSLTRKGFLKMLGLGALAAGSKAYALSSKALEDARSAAKKLKITDVEIFLFDIALTSPFRIAIGVMNAANDLLVRVRTDQGVVGLGEACPFPPITGETQAGVPVSVNVDVTSKKVTLTWQQSPNAAGYYELINLKDGEWRLKLEAEGYRKEKTRVLISGEGTYRQNFQLTPKH